MDDARDPGRLWRDVIGIGEGGGDQLGVLEMGLRALVVYLVLLIVVRLGERRFLTRRSPVDLVLAIILGSVASRAITGNSPFLPSLVAACALVAVHWGVSSLSFHSGRFSKLVKGDPVVLVEHGRMIEKAMRGSHITPGDLDEAIRKSGVERLEDVEVAYLERSGEITVLGKRDVDEEGVPGEESGPLAASPTGGRDGFR